jgi:hypothetical protein
MKQIYRVTAKIVGEPDNQMHFETKEIAEKFETGMIKLGKENALGNISIEKDIINVFENEEDMKNDIISSVSLIFKCKEEGLSPEECIEKYNHYTE